MEFTTVGRKMHHALLDARCLQSTEMIEFENSHGYESKWQLPWPLIDSMKHVTYFKEMDTT